MCRRYNIQNFNPENAFLANILAWAEKVEVSKTQAEKIVGEHRIDKLLIDGKIRHTIPPGNVKRKQKYNLRDCLENMKIHKKM